MYFNVPLLLGALAAATTVSADYLDVRVYCVTLACNNRGTFTTAHGSYEINANEGCRSTGVPGMTEFCMDERNARAHFRFEGMSDKSCFKETSSDISDCGPLTTCGTAHYAPVACSW